MASDDSAGGAPPVGLGRYRILREVGRGTTSVVYQAHDVILGHTVALKTVQPAFPMKPADRDAFEQRFLREAQIAASLSHPNVVRVHDFGRDPGGTLFISLEYLEGAPLADLVAPSSTLLWPEALRIVERIADALHHAHSLGIVHRDVKPANVMLLRGGVPKLLDFGIAKMPEGEGHWTRPGHLMGTPLYMSPEQALGRAVDARSDVFALGALLYFLLTGHAPFRAASIPHVLLRVLREDPVSPSSLQVGIPEAVDYVVARATAKRPADRYASAAAMGQDVADVLAERPPRHRASWTERHAQDTAPCIAVDGDIALAELETQMLSSRETAGETSMSLADALHMQTTAIGASARAFLHRPRPHSGALSAAAVLVMAVLLGYSARRGAEPRALPLPASLAPATPRSAAGQRPIGATAAVPAPLPPASLPPAAPVHAEGTPSSRDARKAEPPRLPMAPAHLAVDLEHSLKDGRLRVWIDGMLRFDQPLDGRGRKTSAGDVLEIAPGAHRVDLEVRWDGNVRTEHAQATFLPGENRRLLARLAGVLKKKIALRWRDMPSSPAALSR